MLKKPVRIMHVVLALEPGGLENGVVNLANRLNPEEFETSVCCLETSGSFARRLPDSVRVFTLGKKPGLSVSAPFKLAGLIRDVRPQVLHTHGLGPLIYTTAARFFSARVPILHGEHRQLYSHDLAKHIMITRKLLYRGCARVHTVSESLKSNLAELGFNESLITAVPNGVDTAKFRPIEKLSAKLEFGLPADSILVGIVARIRPEKKHLLLIRAFAKLTVPIPELRLLIVGSGPAMPDLLNEISELKISSKVVLAGHRDDTPVCYNAMDLMVLPSEAEGLSNSILESMACGVPVLASNACGNNGVIEHGCNGFLTNACDDRALADCVSDAIKNAGLLAEMSKNARNTVLARWTLDKMAEQYKNLYLDIIRNSKKT